MGLTKRDGKIYVICRPMRCAYEPREDEKNATKQCVRGACHSRAAVQTNYTHTHARACTMNIRKSIRNAQKIRHIAYRCQYTTLHTTTIGKNVCWNALVDGGLAYMHWVAETAQCLCACVCALHTHYCTHTAYASKFRWMLCTLELNVLCQEHTKKSNNNKCVYIKWGLPMPNACASV